jgi:hypothetical protein
MSAIHDPWATLSPPQCCPQTLHEQCDPSDDPDPLIRLNPEPRDPGDFNLPAPGDDDRWEVFIPDDDERDPLPDPGDFWISDFD